VSVTANTLGTAPTRVEGCPAAISFSGREATIHYVHVSCEAKGQVVERWVPSEPMSAQERIKQDQYQQPIRATGQVLICVHPLQTSRVCPSS